MATFRDYVVFRDEQVQEAAKELKHGSKGKKKDWLTDLAKDFNKNVFRNDYEDVAYGQSFKGE